MVGISELMVDTENESINYELFSFFPYSFSCVTLITLFTHRSYVLSITDRMKKSKFFN